MQPSRFTVTDLPDEVTIEDPQSGYIMRVVDKKPRVQGQHVLFESAAREYVTGRTMAEIQALIPDLPVSQDLDYIDLGPGLSDLLRVVSAKRVQTAIDSSDYPAMEAILVHAQQLSGTCALIAKYRADIDRLLDNCRVMLNPARVRLISSRFDDALRDPAIRAAIVGTADAVVDCFGPQYYLDPHDPAFRYVLQQLMAEEKALCNPTGKVYANG